MIKETKSTSNVGAKISKIYKFVHKELHEEAAYLVPLRFFIGIGWLRAFTEKILEPEWKDGTALRNFFQTQLDEGFVRFPFYRALINDIFLPNVEALAWIIIIGQLLVGISVLTGTFTNLGLLGGLFMNFNFILAGRVTPSAFYVIIQLVLFIGNVGSTLGFDNIIERYIPYSFLVAQNDYKRRFLVAEKVSYLILGILAFIGAAYAFGYVEDFSPNSVDDPAMLLFILGQICGLSLLISFIRLQPHDVEAPAISSPTDLAFVQGTVGHQLSWTVTDPNPDIFVILEDGKILKRGSWKSGERVMYDLDHLSIGVHRIVLTATDWFGNSNSDAVEVSVLDPVKTKEIDSIQLMQFYREKLLEEKNALTHTLTVVDARKNNVVQTFEMLGEKDPLVERYKDEIFRLDTRKSFLVNSLLDVETLISKVSQEFALLRREDSVNEIEINVNKTNSQPDQ